MQQGHPRHKQLSRARHEMAIHRRYMFAKKINKGMASCVNGLRNIGKKIGKDMINKMRVNNDRSY